jgi:vesicle-fusing ATPase
MLVGWVCRTLQYIPYCIQAKDKVSVTKEDAEKLRVNMGDFCHALEFDVKPAFGISEEQLDNYAYNGILDWSSSIQTILDFGDSAIKQTAESQRTPLVSILLRGNPGSGKTALAATVAKKSGFPYVKVITPENMVGFTESAKCQAVKNVFESAYKSELSCVVIDDIERLLGQY